MADVRIHDLPSAASWNGFFPQDKPGGPTECVSVATVEARLVTDGFVKTAVLVAGYQPLENQRLRTTDNVNFNKLQIAGVDRITATGAFFGTSLQISGATASTMAKWDASKNLVSAVAGTDYLALSNVSGTAGQVAVFSGTNTVGSSTAYTFDGTSLVVAGGRRRLLVSDATKAAIYGASVASPSLTNYSVAWSLDGSQAFINGSANVSLSVGGNVIARATSTSLNLFSGIGLQIAGTDAITSARAGRLTNLTSGVAQVGPLAYDVTYARFGHANFGSNAGGFGFAQNASGAAFVDAPTGQPILLRVNGSTVVGMSASDVTIPLLGSGSTTRFVTASPAGALGISSFANDGPWLPVGGGVVSGATTFSGGVTTASLYASGTTILAGGINGVTDGSSAASGKVGEIISAYASGTSFTGTSAGVSLVSISLPAGSWLVWGSANITNGASPLGLSVYLSYSPTGTSYINANTSFGLGYPVANSGITCHNIPTPINSSSTATVYLIGSEVTTGAVAVNTGATIYAQRIR